MMKKIITALSGLNAGAGFLLVLGAAGSADLNVVDFKIIVIQGIIGLVLLLIGAIGLNFVEEY